MLQVDNVTKLTTCWSVVTVSLSRTVSRHYYLFVNEMYKTTSDHELSLSSDKRAKGSLWRFISSLNVIKAENQPK